MVDIRAERVQVTKARGTTRNHGTSQGRILSIWFNEDLAVQIIREARSRGWTLSHMVRHLCEASIEGIE